MHPAWSFNQAMLNKVDRMHVGRQIRELENEEEDGRHVDHADELVALRKQLVRLTLDWLAHELEFTDQLDRVINRLDGDALRKLSEALEAVCQECHTARGRPSGQ